MMNPSARPQSALAAAGIVLAGGASRRMGQPKALLQTSGGQTFWDEAVEALRSAHIESRVAVIHPDLQEQLARDDRLSTVIVNRETERGQLHSLRLAVEWLHANAPRNIDGAIVLLIDNPGRVTERTAAVLNAAAGKPTAVWTAAWQGRPGHPLWLPRRLWQGAAAWQGDEGLRGFLAHTKEPVLPVELQIPGALTNIDAPDDVERWRNEGGHEPGIP